MPILYTFPPGDNTGMATAPSALPPLPEPIWRWSVERYHEAIRAGIFTPEDRLELLEGVLVEQMSKNTPHRIATRRMADQLRRVLTAGWYVDESAPITTGDSEPEPDVCVVKGTTEQYFEGHPEGRDVALAVEIADSSLFRDRTIKKRIYARAGIAVYWLVDLNARVVEVYTQPAGDEYGLQVNVGGELVLSLDGQALSPIAVADVLPPVERQ
jgi:Uma2 family endonuclease